MMTMLARGLFYVRRLFLSHLGMWASLAAATLLSKGFFVQLQLVRAQSLTIGVAAVFFSLCLALLVRPHPAKRSAFFEQLTSFETALLLLSSLYLLIQATGGPRSWLQPVVYLALAYFVGFNVRWVGLLLTLAAMLLQIGLHTAAYGSFTQLTLLSRQLGFLLAFAFANCILLQVEVVKRRREYKQRLEAEVRAGLEEARDFRLISSALSTGEARKREQEEAMLARGAVEAIHQGMYFVLELLKKSLDLQTCVLLWLDDTGEQLCIKELVTDSSLVREVPISAQAGALGGVVKNRLLLNLRRPRQGARTIPYYHGPEQVGAFIGVPVLEGNHLRGVLCADRRQDRGFTEIEEQLMLEATRQVLRAIQTERMFSAVERSKYEHERFYRASSRLNSALTLAQVYDCAFNAAREIADFDFGALTLFDREKKKHIICRVVGSEQADRFEGQLFADNAGLVAMVVKNKHFLPASDDLRERDMVIFTRKLRLRGMKSLIVLPLIVQDNAVGSFVLAARSSGHFAKKIREMLGVISNQVAVAIENAKMYKRMEEMATTDGLTALPNHRTFQARLSEMLARAERHGKAVSVVLTDVDKFKSVNDTYGHPVGDVVLKRVAKVLSEQVRKVDLVARYGGEEFAMVLEETEGKGAHLFCERVRQEIGAQLMTSDKGSFRVTISLGIATYPYDGKEKKQLIDRADQALYAAKQGGRDRTVLYARMAKSHHAANG